MERIEIRKPLCVIEREALMMPCSQRYVSASRGFCGADKRARPPILYAEAVLCAGVLLHCQAIIPASLIKIPFTVPVGAEKSEVDEHAKPKLAEIFYVFVHRFILSLVKKAPR